MRGRGLQVAVAVFGLVIAGGAAGLALVHRQLEASALARMDSAAAVAERSVLVALTNAGERLEALAGDPRLARVIARGNADRENASAVKVRSSIDRTAEPDGPGTDRSWFEQVAVGLGVSDLRVVAGKEERVLFPLDAAGKADADRAPPTDKEPVRRTNRGPVNHATSDGGAVANADPSLRHALTVAAAPRTRFPLIRQGRADADARPLLHVLTTVPAVAGMGTARALLVATFPAAWLERALAAPETASQLLLVSPDGTTLRATASGTTGDHPVDLDIPGDPGPADSDLTRPAKSSVELLANASPGLRQALAGEPHLGMSGRLRDGLLGAWRPLEAGGQRWVVASELPRAALLRQLVPAAVSVLVAGLLGGVLGSWLGRRQWQRFAAGLRPTLDAAARAQRSTDPAPLSEPTGPAGEIAHLVNLLLAERDQAQTRSGQERSRIATEVAALAEALSDAPPGGAAPVLPPASALLAPVSAAAASLVATNLDLRARLRDTATRFETTTGRLQALVERTRTGAREQGNECGQGGRSAGEVRQAHLALEAGCAQTLELGRRAEHASRLGREAIDDLLTGMEGLQRDTRAATIKIKRLGERSMQVAAIVGSISKLSAQTDMLALNAAIEASRAGEQGQGFTLVAEEVRKLAERASAAAREVERLIEGVRSDVGDAVGGLERQSERLDLHAAAAGAASEALDRAFAAIGDTSEALRQLAASADGEAGAVENLQQTFARLAATATLLSNSGEETARAMRDLREVARALDLPETRPAA